MTNIYAAQGKIADMQADAAKKALDSANQAVNADVVKVGVGEPSAAYQAAVSQVAWLQQTQANYTAMGESTSADLMKGPIAAAQKKASTIGATLPQYNVLLSAQTVANATYQSVLGDQRKVQVQEAAAADPGVIQTSAVSADVTPSSIAKLVVPVFGAAVLLAIILIALFEFIAAVRRQPSSQEVLQRGGSAYSESAREQIAAREQKTALEQKTEREQKPALKQKPARASSMVDA